MPTLQGIADFIFIPIAKASGPYCGRAITNEGRNVNGSLDVPESIVGIMGGEPVRGCKTIQLEADPAIFIARPLEDVRRPVPDGVDHLHHVEAIVVIELGLVNIGMQILIKRLPEKFLIEGNGIVSGPGGGCPAFYEPADLMREMVPRRQARIIKLLWRDAGHGHNPGGRQNVRRQPAPDVHPFDLNEIIVCQNGRKL